MEKTPSTTALLSKAHCLLVVLFLGTIAPLLHAASPGSFYGFWETEEAMGDKCVFNIKRGGRASCFFVGSASTDITKGRWEIVDSRLIITWDSGHRDALTVNSRLSLKREAYNPESNLEGPADYTAIAYRIDSRVPGSLTLSAAEIERARAAEPETEETDPFSLNGPSSKDPAMQAPGGAMRNPFVGYWEIEQNPGLFFGLGGSNADRFYLFLDRNGEATVSLRNNRGKEDTVGIWHYTQDQAQITWPSGRKDILQKVADSFELASLGAKDAFDDRPDSRRAARPIKVTEAARFFSAGDIRRITMTMLRGYWQSTDPAYANEGVIRILGWGHAELLKNGEVAKTGKWEIMNDHSVVKWNDGSRDVLRDEFHRWSRSTFADADSRTPLKQFVVTRTNDGTDLSETSP